MLQTFYKLNLKPKTILELKGIRDDLQVLWKVVNILSIRYELFKKCFIEYA